MQWFIFNNLPVSIRKLCIIIVLGHYVFFLFVCSMLVNVYVVRSCSLSCFRNHWKSDIVKIEKAISMKF